MAFAAKRKDEYTAAELIDGLRGLHVTGGDLRRLVELTQELITKDLARRVNLLKETKDGAGLPWEVLARGLVAHDCRCAAALRLTADE